MTFIQPTLALKILSQHLFPVIVSELHKAVRMSARGSATLDVRFWRSLLRQGRNLPRLLVASWKG